MIERLLPTTAIVVALLGFGLAGCAQSPDGDPSGSAGALSGSGDVGTERVETMMRLGDFSLASGDIAGAISLYRRAHILEPNAVAPLSRLGAAWSRLGSYEEASGAYQAALEIDPANADVKRGLGNALIALRRPQDALNLLGPQADVADADPRLQNSRGVAHDMLGQHGPAQRLYRQGLAARPSDLTLKSNLALSLSLDGNDPEAIRLAQEAAAHPQATTRHRQTLAMILAFAGQDAEAARVLRSVTDEADVARNLAYYRQLEQIPFSGDRAAAIGGAGSPAISQ